MKLYFQIKIQTPKRTIVDQIDANGIFFQSSKGPLHILPGYTHILVNIEDGVMMIEGVNLELFYITDGICKVIGKQVHIYCSKCLTSNDIDYDKLLENIIQLEEKLKTINLTADEADEIYQMLKKLKSQRQLSDRASSIDEFISSR